MLTPSFVRFYSLAELSLECFRSHETHFPEPSWTCKTAPRRKRKRHTSLPKSNIALMRYNAYPSQLPTIPQHCVCP